MMKASLKNATFLTLLFVVALLPVAHIKILFWGIPFYLPELAIFLAGALFFFRLVTEGGDEKKRAFPDKIFLWGCLFFVLGTILSFVKNEFSLTGLGMLKSWIFFPILFGLLLWSETRDIKRRQLVLSVWGIVLVGVALRSLILFFSGDLTYDGRLAGDYSSPNFLALVVAPASLLVLFFLFSPLTTREGFFGARAVRKILFSSGLLLFLSVLFFTHSYGVWVGVFGALLFFFLGQRKVRKFSGRTLFASALLLVSFFGLFVFEQGSEKWNALISQDERSSFASRAMIWRSSARIARDHPLWGIGIGRFQKEYLKYQQYFPPYLEWAVPQPHNLLLAVFLSSGFLGLFGFLLFLGRILYLLGRNFLTSREEKDRHFYLLLLSLWMIVLLYGLTDTPFFKNDLALLFFLIIALSLPHKKSLSKREKMAHLPDLYNSMR